MQAGDSVALLDDIASPGRGSRARVLHLDGEPWRTTSLEIVRELDLRVGLVVDTADLERDIDAAEPASARERALRLLAYRDRASEELRGRLAQDGYSPPVAAAVIADLLRVGVLDDARFAASTVRVLATVRGYGRTRVLRELQARGVDPSISTAALAEHLSDDDEAASALRLARAFAARPGADVGRLAARLVRKGFRPALALSVAREALASLEYDDPVDLRFRDD
jgi:SOS response regulatory protein OraA/RecX